MAGGPRRPYATTQQTTRSSPCDIMIYVFKAPRPPLLSPSRVPHRFALHLHIKCFEVHGLCMHLKNMSGADQSAQWCSHTGAACLLRSKTRSRRLARRSRQEAEALTQYRVPLSVFPGSSRFGNRTQNSRVQSGRCKTEPPARWGSGAHSGRGLMSVWSQTDMRRHCTK